MHYLFIDNLATIISAGAAFLVFVDNGYYGTLFQHFGLRHSVLTISQVELRTMGLSATVYAIPKIIWNNSRNIALGALAPLLLVSLWYIVRNTKFGRSAKAAAERLSAFHDRHSSWFVKWPTIIFFRGAGLLAGSLGGKHDAHFYEQERRGARNCFAIRNQLYRGVVLAQDQNRTILLYRDRLSVVKNDDISFVSACPTRRVQRTTT